MSPFAALTLFPQYRYALQSEVYTLFLDGGMTAIDTTPRTSDYLDARNLTSLLGITFNAGPQHFGSQGFAERTTSPGVFIDPFVAVDSTALTGRVYPGAVSVGPTFAIQDVGVFLVRELPEPSTLALLGLGLTRLARIPLHRRSSHADAAAVVAWGPALPARVVSG